MKNTLAFLLATLLPSLALAGQFLRSDDEPTMDLRRDLQQAVNNPFVEKDGLVVMEAENVPVHGFWRSEKIYSHYTGTGYLRFDGNTILGGPVNSTLSYNIQINNPGSYIMEMRARKNNTNTGLANDCWVRLVGQPGLFGAHTKAFLGGRFGAFHSGMMNELQPSKTLVQIIYNFPAPGVYVFELSGRSQHFVIDRIMLYDPSKVARLDAERSTVPESPRLSNPSALQYIQLFTAGTGSSTYLRNLQDGDVISFNTVGTNLSIIANTFGDVGAVQFLCEGKTKTESSAPYQINGGSTTENTPFPYLSTPGLKTVTITVLGKVAGSVLAKQTISFTLTAATSAPTRAPSVPVPVAPPTKVRALSSLELVSALGTTTPYTVLSKLVDGAVIDQATFGTKLSVLAQVAVPVTAVHFFYGGKVFKESLPIYAMIGNEGNVVFPVPYLSTTGAKTMTVKAFGGTLTSLVEIDSITVKFEIVAAAVSPVAPPVAVPATTKTPVSTAPTMTAARVTSAPVTPVVITASPSTAPVAIQD